MTAEILFVEDNPADRKIALEVLKKSRYAKEVHIAEDGEIATAMLLKTGDYISSPTPDLIILDLNLPKKDGREILAEVKSHSVLKLIPVVVLTSSDAEADIQKAYSLGANCYLTKPSRLNEFLMTVRKIEEFWLEYVRIPSLNLNPPS